MLNSLKIYYGIAIICICLLLANCKVPAVVQTKQQNTIPSTYTGSQDTTNTGTIQWKNFFTDSHLTKLIDTALVNNRELLITLQEIEIARNDIRVKQGQLFPFVTAGAGVGIDKVGRYT